MKKVIFNNGVYSNGPSFNFGRSGSTVDDLGNAIDSNVPRYAKLTQLTKHVRDSDFVVQNSTANVSNNVTGDIGYDKDHATPLGVIMGNDLALRFFLNDLSTPVNTRTSASFTRTVRTGVDKVDLMKDATGIDTSVYHEYSGSAGTIFNVIPGAILCFSNQKDSSDDSVTGNATLIEITKPSNGSWGDSSGFRSIGVIESTVDGAGVSGGNKWSFQGYYPENLPGDSTLPLKIWIVGTDYKTSPPGGGGVIFLFRATRPDLDSNWTYGPIKTISIALSEATHIHSAGIVFGRNGSGYVNRIEIISSVGDTDTELKSYLTRHWCDDPDNYSTATWNAQLDFHGKEGPLNGTAIFADQPASFCPGPEDRTLLTASDLWSYTVTKLEVPTDTSAKAIFTEQWGGYFHGGWHGLFIKCLDPVNRRYYLHTAISQSEEKYNRILWSEDGTAWNPVCMSPENTLDGLLWNRQIVRRKASEISLSPEITSEYRRPLRIGPGGVNRLLVNPPSPSNFATFLTGSFGNWTWPSGYDGVDVPDPPTRGKIYDLDAPSGVRSELVFRHGHINSTSITGPHMMSGAMATRWYYNAAPGYGCNVTVSQGSPAVLSGNAGGGRFGANKEWVASVFGMTPTDTGIYANRLELAVGSTNNVYPYKGMAVPAVIYDNRDAFPGWNVNAGEVGGNERFNIGNLSCGSSWTCYSYLRIPNDSWLFPNGLTVQTQIPIYTIYSDSDNYIYVYVDIASSTHQIKADVVGGGSALGTLSCNITSTMLLEMGDELRIGVSHSGSEVNLTAIIAGKSFNSTAVSGQLSSSPTEIRSGKPAFQEYVWSDAANIDFFGFYVDNEQSHSSSEMSDGLADIELMLPDGAISVVDADVVVNNRGRATVGLPNRYVSANIGNATDPNYVREPRVYRDLTYDEIINGEIG